jgi:hypothetical protein
MSETIGKLTSLELRQANDGRLYWMDEESGQIPEADALSSLGIDPEAKQAPITAVWHNKDHDIPVTIVGVHGRLNDEDFLMAEETNAGIPRSELEFVSSETPADKDRYTQQLEESNRQLTEQNRLLLTQNETLTAENERLLSELATVKADLARLERRFDEFRGETEPEEARTESDAEEPQAEPVAQEAVKDGRIFPGTVVDIESGNEKSWGLTAASGIWKGPDGHEYITFIDEGKPRWAPVENVSIHEEDIETVPVVPLEAAAPRGGFVSERESSLSWRDRAADWLTFRRPVTYLQTRRPVGGGPETEYEEEITEDRYSPAAVVAGFLGAAAIGAFIGWELKNTGHSHTTEIINQNKHLKEEVHNMHTALNHDSGVISQNNAMLKHDTAVINDNHRILKHNRAVLKQLHEQVHHLFKIEKAENVRELSAAGAGGSEARLSFYGDTVWHETARRMHHASAAQIRKATNYILRINGLRWNGGGYGVDAHKLPLGFRFRIPENIVQIVNR